jgi:hypothetical protein
MKFLVEGPTESEITILLAHGAGTPMDSPFMDAFARGIAAAGYCTVRFEFPYMAARRVDGKKRPPNPQPVLLAAYRAAIAECGLAGWLVIGGKSLGGRIASLVADELGVRGLLCLGFPFHAPGREPGPRIEHLEQLVTPTLIVQGTRDPFGSRIEVESYPFSAAISIRWLEDGDHDLRPRASSGRILEQNWSDGITAAVEFLRRLA